MLLRVHSIVLFILHVYYYVNFALCSTVWGEETEDVLASTNITIDEFDKVLTKIK